MSSQAVFDKTSFAFDAGLVWLSHCSEGPVPLVASESAEEFLERERRPWALRWSEDFLGLPARVRRAFAALSGAGEDDVTLTATTSSGLVTVAQGWPWEPGDEVLLPLGEFPSNVWPWKALAARGVSVREVPLWDGHVAGAHALESTPPGAGVRPEERIVEAIGPATRVVSVSWVRFQDGLRVDLEPLARACRERGVALCVDAIQGLGTLPCAMNEWGVDALASGGHKGLLAPQGVGGLATSAAMRERLAPLGSWLSVEQGTDFARASTDHDREWLTGGERLEQGVPNLLGCAACAPALEMIVEAGPARIAAHVDALQERLLDALGQNADWRDEAARLDSLRQAGRLGSILSLHHGGRGHGFLEELRVAGARDGIYASVREGYLRIALHGWHDGSDVDRIARWLLQSRMR